MVEQSDSWKKYQNNKFKIKINVNFAYSEQKEK